MPVSVTPFCVEMQYKSSCMLHRLRTYDGYFPNSFHPISNMGCIWVTSEKQSFVFVEKQLNDENHRAGTHRVKMGDDSVAKNTPNTPKSIWQICPMGPKVCEIQGEE